MTSRRIFSDTGNRPPERVNVPKKPMRNEPEILIAIVLQGNSCGAAEVRTETKYRISVPKAPPSIINKQVNKDMHAPIGRAGTKNPPLWRGVRRHTYRLESR